MTFTLVYPYFRPRNDNSVFRFPPLGLGYIVSYLKQHGISANLVDCTFLDEREAIERVISSQPRIVGIYSMFSMKKSAIGMAKLLRGDCETLVAGGPLPTLCPEDFLMDFDIVAVGEGEKTALGIANIIENGNSLSSVKGIIYREKGGSGNVIHTPPGKFIQDLDALPFPDRDQFDNEAYMNHYRRRFGYTVTSMITSRGCPFSCDFCSRAVFGNVFRTRSSANIVSEMEEVRKLGYDRISFSDDCFTLDKNRLLQICDKIIQMKLDIKWECLSRVDTISDEIAAKMKKAGCTRVFFGLESGNDVILSLMKKQATVYQAKKAVLAAKSAKLDVGAFFIIGYPGETNKTVLDTLKFASSLPVDYLSFTMPYPIPGTSLYEKVRDQVETDDYAEPKHRALTKHKLIYRSSFSETKLKLAIMKGSAQFRMRKKLGARGYKFLGEPFERFTNGLFKLVP